MEQIDFNDPRVSVERNNVGQVTQIFLFKNGVDIPIYKCQDDKILLIREDGVKTRSDQ